MSKTKDQRSKINVVAILLAAGQSKRMGAFKPLLPFGETTVIRSCINNLQAGGINEIVVVVGHRASELESSLRDLTQVHVVVNPDPTSEMSASIIRGVECLPATAKAVVIALTDQPAIPGSVIGSIIAAWHDGAKLIIPEFQGRGGHPVLLDLEFRDQLLTLDPQLGLNALFNSNKDHVLRLPVNSSYIARDMDTWDDYRALHEDVFGTPPNTWTADRPGLLPTN
jgi:CTP:molybdopterin cytidylyltransferase MocA